ncbi:hypothetical protein LUZ63_011602 [Rhynchospora breviuscula]|uniref:Uncharacterized protein n=1 Tax=Rhynchospora breviuscula TaxID=2022672 RepID=A0A9Q0HQP5_9POAL|nr:hypothetical protein LUZ63_011602 [Rhynchospora breviuscula]
MAQPDHTASEIRRDDPLALSIKNKLDREPFQYENMNRQFTVFRVPSYIRESNKNFYEPRIISIGPYHRDREHLKCMEEQKVVYLRKLLPQNDTDVTLNKFLEVLRELEPVARRCYYEKIDMDADQFVEMLLFDACFIIQLAVNWYFQEEDILSEIGWTVPLIKTDLLMLENQIPFFVLQRVFELYSSIDDTLSSDTMSNFDSTSQDSVGEKASLFDLLVTFLQQGNEPLPLPEADQSFDHLLEFYYHCFMTTQKLPDKPKNKLLPLELFRAKKVFPLISSSIKRLTTRRRPKKIARRKPRMVPCATELKDAGVTFKKTEAKSVFLVNFSNGVLRIPYIQVEEATRPQLMNLIAFEQCGGQKEKPLTSYAVFMDCIVNTPRDVLILQQNGIIENKLANEKEAAEFFNQLRYCTYLDYEKHHLADLFKTVKKYCDSRWQKYRAKLYRDYFSNPWSIISFFAAIMLLFLATVQTLYTVLSYYRRS